MSDGTRSTPESDLHLVETAGQWQLTVNLTERVRDALRLAEAGAGRQTAPRSITVHIEPNLVPGDPFAAVVELVPEPRPGPGPGDRTEGRGAEIT